MPNPFKVVMMVIEVYLILKIFKVINKKMEKFKVLTLLFKQLDYFSKTFVKYVKKPRVFKNFEISEDIEIKERIHDQIYWLSFLVECQDDIKKMQKTHWSLLVMPPILLFYSNIWVKTFFKFENNIFSNFLDISGLRIIAQFWIGYKIDEENDHIFVQD